MGKSFKVFMIMGLLCLAATSVFAYTESDPFVTDLIIGGGAKASAKDIGDVEIWNDRDFLYVKYVISYPDWCIMQTHLEVATSLSAIPQKKGNPIPGKFEYIDKHDCVSEFVITIPLTWAPGTELFIASHAVVRTAVPIGNLIPIYLYETVWGFGSRFPGKNWATYIKYRIPAGSIGDVVWDDLNRNGIQDAGESGISRIEVNLYDCLGNKLASTFTCANGSYSFSGLHPGDYRIKFVAHDRFLFSPPNQGGDPARDSNADQSTGLTSCITIASGEHNSTIDAGLYEITPAIDLEKYIGDQDADEAPGVALTVGDPVVFTFAVTNVGDVDLTNVAVTDDVLGEICTVFSLEVGDTTTCTVAIPAELGLHQNIGTVTAEYNGYSTSDSDPAVYTATLPNFAIDLEKYIGDQDADEAPGVALTVGDPVVFTFAVTNVGDVDLTNVAVTDDVLGAICTVFSLEVGDTTTCTVAIPAELGLHQNIGTVTADYNGYSVSDSDPAFYTATLPNFAIDIEKFINGQDADEAPGVALTVGESVNFAYVVTNVGDVDLTNVAVTDDVLGSICTVFSLGAGESGTCSVTIPAELGLHQNIGTVTAEYNGYSVSDSDLAVYTGSE